MKRPPNGTPAVTEPLAWTLIERLVLGVCPTIANFFFDIIICKLETQTRLFGPALTRMVGQIRSHQMCKLGIHIQWS